MKPGKFNCIIDQAWGSSGKGKISAWLADKFGIVNVSSSNYPNAGHTASFQDGTKFVAKALPTAAILKKIKGVDIKCFVSPGSGFFWKQLIKEWNQTDRPKIFIHDRTSIVTDEHKRREESGTDSTKHVASTMQGTAAAITDRIMRKPDVILARSSSDGGDPVLNAVRHLINTDEETSMWLNGMPNEFCEQVKVVDAFEFRNLTHNIINEGHTWLHEGSQGYALSIDHGSHYPFCLWGDSRVLMASGKTIKIRDLKKHIGEEVLSVGKNGKICSKPIINWWKNPLNGREWFNIVTETSVYNHYDQQWIGPKFTGDHKIKTVRGKKQIQNLEPGDQIFINEYELSGDGLQIFLGSILGDGSIPNINKSPKRASFQFSHCEAQKEYCSDKAKIFKKYINGRLRPIITGSNSFKSGQKHLRFETYYSLTIRKWAERLGSFGKKKLNIHLLVSLLDERGLAIWYQDDGRYKHSSNGRDVHLHVEGFDLETKEQLISELKEKFNLHFTINKQKSGKYLRLARKDHIKWFSMVEPYIHPCFQYKLPDQNKAAWLWDDHSPNKCATEVVLDVVRSRTRKHRGESVCFDIEVEGSHNFFVANEKGYFNVENCTSRNCTLQAAMDHMAIPPHLVGDVYMNLRTVPIRVGNVVEEGEQKGYSGDFYPDCKELTWEQVADQAGMPEEEKKILAERERTTVTKRIRRVSTFSWIGLQDAVRTNGVTKISVNFIQYLDWNDHKIQGGQEALKKLSKKSRQFIEKVEEVAQCPVVLIGTGADHNDIISLL